MKLVQTIKELQSELDALRSEGKTIGLVPTMVHSMPDTLRW